MNFGVERLPLCGPQVLGECCPRDIEGVDEFPSVVWRDRSK
ncbi:hypothetical protein [Halohasta litchfieldiae]|nr:hypothetical protein [Halohasta litchfieldiae]